MSTVSTGTIYSELKPNLDAIVTDKTDGVEAASVIGKIYKVDTQNDAYDDDVEIAMTGGYATEKAEGDEITLAGVRQGGVTRYLLRTFARKLRVTEEAQKFNKYPEAIDAAKRLKRLLWKTANYDSAGMFVHQFDTAYVPGPDGKPLVSATHATVDGGTFSNLGTALTASPMAFELHRTQVMNMPGHDGLPCDDLDIKAVVFPNAQWGTWERLLMSKFDPTAGEFNAINIMNSSGKAIKPIRHPYWRNTTSNYTYLTDAEYGLRWKWGWKPKSRTWVDNNTMSIMYAIDGNWARSCSNFRGVLGINV